MTKEVQNELNKILPILMNELSSVSSIIPLHGGSINEVYSFNYSGKKFVCKVNASQNNGIDVPSDFFEIEKKNLDFLRGKSGFKIPEIITVTSVGNTQFICMEYIISSEKISNWYTAGLNLADLHTNKSETFGFEYDNYMGSLVQKNTVVNSFNDFFITQRLNPLVKKCYDSKLIDSSHLRQFEKFYSELNSLLPLTTPTLIHGDLWKGNIVLGIQDIALIDPAISYSHPEADLAMSVLFGGFHSDFYEAYEAKISMVGNWRVRSKYFNLYPNLIHLYLFGERYKSEIIDLIKKF